MRQLFTTWLACLALVVAMSMSVSAQQQPTSWDSAMQTREILTTFPMPDPTPMPQVSATLNPADPDRTGYPSIDQWKGNLVRDPKPFLTDTERQYMTRARVDLTAAVAPLFKLYQDRFRIRLSHGQLVVFEAIVATQDLERLAVMTDADCDQYVTQVSQRVHLDSMQEQELHNILGHLMTRIAPLQDQYAARFGQQIAAAEQRMVAERATRNAAISTSPPDLERK